MTVTSIQEIAPGKGGRSNGPHDSAIVRVWRIKTDSPFDTPATIQPAMPFNWGAELAGTGMIARSADYNLIHKGPGLSVWEARFTFESNTVDQEEIDRASTPNPVDRRCRCQIRHVRYGELTILDRDGNVKRTSAGEIYEPKERDASRYSVNLHKNYVIIPDWVWDLQDKLNNAAVVIRGRTCAAGTLKMTLDHIPEIQVENGFRHFPVHWTLDYRREGWVDSRVDAGFYFLNDEDELTRMTTPDDEGNEIPTTVEEWLDGSGKRLRDTIDNPQPGDETINEFHDYEAGDYSDMPLSEVASGDARI